MPTFYDSHGQAYVPAEEIGRGGEGTVYSLPDDSTLVAKIYHEPVSDEKAEKLRWMAANQDEQLLKFTAWIVDTLHERAGGPAVGFLMPSVRAKEIHELYSLKSRRVYFPDATWQFLVHAAANLARAFYCLHKNGHIMGDVNHGNCVVLADGTVKLIDCDSYSVSTGDQRYTCEVGVATHLAPELQGKNLRDITRDFKHDNFGLAVIIFQLLFLGRHPFAGNYLGDEDKSLEECIRERRFAYSPDAHLLKIRRPPGTLPLTAVTPQMAAMFERAFLTEDRPDPREWVEALEDLSRSLRQCGLHPGHFYFEQLPSCPWCAIESQTGLMLFPFLSGGRDSASADGGLNIFTIENLVASFEIPQNLPAVPPKPLALPEPSPEAQTVRTAGHKQLVLLAVFQVGFVFFSVFFIEGCGAFIGSMLLMFGLLKRAKQHKMQFKDRIEDRFHKASWEWEKLEREWSKAVPATDLPENLDRMRAKIGEYRNLQQQAHQRLKALQNESLRRGLEEYLAAHRLTTTEGPGIDVRKLSRLTNSGVKTAADVDAARLLAVSFADESLKKNLLEWRKQIESTFEDKSDPKILDAQQKQVASEFSERRRQIEREIEQMLVTLRSGSARVQGRQRLLLSKAENLSRSLLQAEADLKAVNIKVLASVTLISVTIFTFFVGTGVKTAIFERILPPAIYSPSAYPSYEVPRPAANSTHQPTETYRAEVVPENLTEKEIAELSFSEREIIAKRLYEQAVKAAYTDDQYDEAERKLRLAVRINAADKTILNELAYVLYWQKEFNESLKLLDKALVIDPENTVTRTYIGMNYLKLKRYGDARLIFVELAEQNPHLFEAFYNLGLAYQGLNDYAPALRAFESASEILPTDTDARIEIGRCLYKTGDRAAARKQYEDLLELDPDAAERLRRIIGIKKAPKPKGAPAPE